MVKWMYPFTLEVNFPTLIAVIAIINAFAFSSAKAESVNSSSVLLGYDELMVPANEADSLILVAFYNSTEGWEDLTWLEGPVKDWNGVTLDENGRVIKLELFAFEVFGNIPSELGNLDRLQVLDLSGNNLNGSIPSELGNLTELVELDLGYNSLGGQIPSELGNLQSLSRLILVENSLTGTIPSEIGELENLSILNVRDNFINESLPELIFNFVEAGVPNLKGKNVSSIRVLDLGGNQISGSIPEEIEQFISLDTLGLDDNMLSGTIPSKLGNLSSLKSLDISGNEFSGSIPSELWNLTNLISLGISDIDLPVNLPPEIGNLINLEYLDVSDNELITDLPDELWSLSNLKSLNLSDTDLEGPIPSVIESFSNLIHLDVSDNDVTGSIPEELWNLTNLEYLDVSDNEISGDLASEIGNLVELKELNLMDNNFSGGLPSELWDLTKLEVLDLSDNLFSGAIPSELGNLDSLQYLYLDNTLLSSLPDLTMNPPTNLITIDVSNSRFTFKDIIPNLGIPSFMFSYSFQEPFGEAGLLQRSTGGEATFSVDDFDYTGNVYQWEKDGVELVGETTSTLTVSDIAEEDYGVYTAKVTNPGLFDLEIESEPFYLVSGFVSSQDSLALVSLYNGTEGNSWINNTNWLNAPVHTWYGITLNGDAQITEISLTSNQLSGNIPAEIGNLTGLESLSLQVNQLTGSIPPELGNLAQLERLYLHNNDLSGSIPAELGDLANLEYLWLSRNELTGNIPDDLWNLANLLQLDLQLNQLTGEIPSAIENLTNVERLLLNNNRLTGDFPAEVADLDSLTWLFINSNFFESFPDLSENPLPNLQQFRISFLKLTFRDIIPNLGTTAFSFLFSPQRPFGDTTSVKLGLGENVSFNVDEIDYTDNAYQWEKDGVPLDGETSSTLSITGITDSDFGAYAVKVTNPGLPTLEVQSEPFFLNGFVNEQDSLALVALYDNTNGESWLESQNWLTGPLLTWDGISLEYIDGEARVKELDLSGNQLSGDLPSELWNLTSLTSLNLSGNELTGTISDDLANLNSLEYLYLDNNYFLSFPDLSNVVSSKAKQVTNLKLIDIDNLKLTFKDIIPNLNVADSISYAPQNPFSSTVHVEVAEGESAVFNFAEIDFEGNEYQWKKDGELLEGETTFSLSLTEIAKADSGSYTLEIVNSTLPDLEIESEPIVLSVRDGNPVTTEVEALIPTEFSLSQNYPNPFNPTSTIRFGLPEASEVTLNVYNMLGQKVSTLLDNRSMEAGWHSIQFNALQLSSGMYLYRISTGDYTQTRKMMLIK